jgi:ribose 5-phosphate isomerase B
LPIGRYDDVKIAIGSDHGGYELKEDLIKYLETCGYEAHDMGTCSKESCDYPLIGFEVAKAVSAKRADCGVLICKTGIGMVVIANKVHGVRAAACYDIDMAKFAKEHNDTNVLVLGANYMNAEKARQIFDAWINAQHTGERHTRRVNQIKEIESTLRLSEAKLKKRANKR